MPPCRRRGRRSKRWGARIVEPLWWPGDARAQLDRVEGYLRTFAGGAPGSDNPVLDEYTYDIWIEQTTCVLPNIAELNYNLVVGAIKQWKEARIMPPEKAALWQSL